MLEAYGTSVHKKLHALAVATDIAAAEESHKDGAEKEANPLYPVPKLMTKTELEQFYYQISEKEL